MDFSNSIFVKQKINRKLFPYKFTSVQDESGKIYVIGGLIKDLVLPVTFRLDEELNFDEVGVMSTGRYAAPVTLLADSFILVAGGCVHPTDPLNYTRSTEIFDIKTF
jgi:hypothetical protein